MHAYKYRRGGQSCMWADCMQEQQACATHPNWQHNIHLGGDQYIIQLKICH